MMRWFLVLWAGLCLIVFAQASEPPPLVLQHDTQRASLEGKLAHWVDVSATATLDQVEPQHFTLLPSFRGQGYSAAAHWYRFQLNRTPDAPTRWVLSIGRPTLDELDLWVQRAEGGYEHLALGDHRPYAQRPLHTRSFAIPLDVQGPTHVYMRVRTTSSVTVNAEVVSPDAFVGSEAVDHLIHGIYFGALLIVTLFYLMLGAWLRDAIMGAYAGYVASLVLMHLGLNGYLPMLFVADSTWINDALSRIGFLAGTAFFVLMWDRLLNLRPLFPRIHRLYLLVGWGNVAMLPFAFLPQYRDLAPALNVVSLLVGFANPFLLWVLWWRDRRFEQLVYVVAFVIPVVGGLTHIAMEMAWLPQNRWTSNIYQAASLVHVLVMSFGLALRLRQMQRDKASAEQSVALAAQRAEEQRRFVAMLSHEFRNPLAAIDRSAQMIQFKAPDLPAAEAQRLVHIRSNTATLSGFVDNFLMTEALDHGALALSCESTEIAPLLESVVRIQGDVQSLRVRWQVSPPNMVFWLDPTLIGVAVGNLLGNALRYSPPDSPVEISASLQAGQLHIRVTDQGPGLSPEELKNLGSPYFRAGSSMGKKGSGLGYHFTQRIIQAHGGSVTAHSRTEGGLEVCIVLK